MPVLRLLSVVQKWVFRHTSLR